MVNRIRMPQPSDNAVPEVTEDSHIKSGTVNSAYLHEEIL